LLLCPSVGWADDAATAVTGRQGDRPVKFAGGLGTYYEGLVIALLGDCHTENPRKATKEQWDNALKGDHLRVQFAKPRKFAVSGEPEEVDADEIVVPISASQAPDCVYVRSGDGYRAFAKYEYKICSFIQENLKSLADR
jgi:hypothetical protein